MPKTQLRITNLSFSYDTLEVLRDVNAIVNQGDRLCIVGDNGSGKSTLVQLMSKQLVPRTGGVAIDGNVLVLEQEIQNKERVVQDYLMEYVNPREEYKLYMALEEANCDFDLDQTIRTLSGGQQTKLRFAALFLLDADIVILDEPTNHLDKDAVAWLVDWVYEYKGIVVFVSHDRRFINQCATRIREVQDGEIMMYEGNYDAYMERKQHDYALALQAYKRQERKKKKMEQRLALIKQRASAYDRPALGALLRSKRKAYHREFVDNALEKPSKNDQSLSLTADGGVHASKLLFSTQGLKLGYDDIVLLKKLSLEMRGSQRVLLEGPNGSGKSTLLRFLYKQLTGTEQSHPQVHTGNDLKIGYFAQHTQLPDSSLSVYDRYITHVNSQIATHEIVSKLEQLGVSYEDRDRPVSRLSYGQKVKLQFYALLEDYKDILILDEPTNHLDISTREVLEGMLADYSGAILLVSHDVWFAENVHTTDVRTIEDGTISCDVVL